MSRFIGFVFATCLLAIGISARAQATNPEWPKSLTLVTASPGGVYYIYGEELARMLADRLGIVVNPSSTQGAINNMRLLDRNEAQLGLITMSTGNEGWNGTAAWTNGKQFRNIRALFSMYDNPVQALVLQKSGITTLAQLDQKRIGVGPRSGTGASYGPVIFKIVGISPQLSYGSYDDIGRELLDGHIEGLVTTLGASVPALHELDAKEPIKFLSFSAEQMEAIRNLIPELSPSKIPAGTYRLLDRDYITLAVPNFVVGRADLPESLVYELVKAVFKNQDRLVKVTPLARDTLPQNVVKNTFMPFHPGAVRYYREIGIKIPDALVPTN